MNALCIRIPFGSRTPQTLHLVLCLCCAGSTLGNVCNAPLPTLSCVQLASLPAGEFCVGMLQIFALFLVHAYSTRLWKPQAADSSTLSPAAIEHGFQSPEGHSKLIMDGPWILLWPCLLIWPFFEGVVGFGFIHNGIGDAILLATTYYFCCLGHHVSARSPTAMTVISASCCTCTAFSSSGCLLLAHQASHLAVCP